MRHLTPNGNMIHDFAEDHIRVPINGPGRAIGSYGHGRGGHVKERDTAPYYKRPKYTRSQMSLNLGNPQHRPCILHLRDVLPFAVAGSGRAVLSLVV